MPAYRPIREEQSFFALIIFPFLIGASVGLLLSGVLIFLGVNLSLGCDTWQQEFWTEYNSCWYPFMPEWNPPRG